MNNEDNQLLTRIENLVESNAKSIQSLTNNLSTLSDEVRMTQRQMRDTLSRIDSNSANIRELILENQRILRYLENERRS